jgi:hypothetical protein
MRTGFAAVLLYAAITGTGCVSRSAVAPTDAAAPRSPSSAQTASLTVRVLARESESPIAGAAVRSEATVRTTDAAGVCVLPFVVGEELDVRVSAPGFEPMGASATLAANERWTFYLPKSR